MIALFYVTRNIKERRIIGNWIFFILSQGKLLLFQLDKNVCFILYIQNIFCLPYPIFGIRWILNIEQNVNLNIALHDFKLSIKYV